MKRIPYQIVYEDEEIIVVNKNYNVLTIATDDKKTFHNNLQYYLNQYLKEKKEKVKKEKPPKPPKEPDNSPKIPAKVIVIFLVLAVSIVALITLAQQRMGYKLSFFRLPIDR